MITVGVMVKWPSKMNTNSITLKLVLSVIVFLVPNASGAHLEPIYQPTIKSASTTLVEDNNSARPAKFACLSKEVRLDETVSYGKGNRRVTVEQKLVEMKARCRNGKLVDLKNREIRFFRPSCWGNPPPDYLEIQKRENEELAKLKRRYAVVVFACNPMIQ